MAFKHNVWLVINITDYQRERRLQGMGEDNFPTNSKPPRISDEGAKMRREVPSCHHNEKTGESLLCAQG
ncbi:hypothetical protein PROFUN_06290 [Planoprotostelium fungivorum]|uniref:Uncharacterized protein n=1 Tax=Planoprotostelium fungivorum TaxID=1890364 RepID=A0A2P6NE87_9EUKA|nr:hypothetical protein PROFUN_06290 [Planoprotostelium fungivorum]